MYHEFPVELQKRLELAISEGEISQGARLTVPGIADRFGAAEAQARRVLLAALRKGQLERVAEPDEAFFVLGVVAPGLDSVFSHTAKAGLKPTSHVREVVVEPATAPVADRLRLEVGSPVHRYVRTRFAEGQPLANQTNYIPYEVCPGLEKEDVSHQSFQKLLEGKYRTVMTGMQETFAIVAAHGEDREVLGLPEGSSVLQIERLALSRSGWPVVWALIHIRPDRYLHVAALWPKAAELLRPTR